MLCLVMDLEKTPSAGVLMNEMARLSVQAMQRRLAPLQLSPAQFMALSVLWTEDGLTQRDLAARLGVEQATMANTLSRMERDGLIWRRPHPDDGRSQQIRLTQAAQALEQSAMAAAQAVNETVLAALPQAERGLFLSMITRVIAGLRDQDKTG